VPCENQIASSTPFSTSFTTRDLSRPPYNPVPLGRVLMSFPARQQSVCTGSDSFLGVPHREYCAGPLTSLPFRQGFAGDAQDEAS
jgi:hypothetical protein